MHVGHIDRFGVRCVADIDCSTVQANAQRCAVPIKHAVVEACCYGVFHCRTREGLGNQLPDQQPGYRRITVGKMEDVWLDTTTAFS